MSDERPRPFIVRMSREMVEEDPLGYTFIRSAVREALSSAEQAEREKPSAEERARRRWGVLST